MDTMNNYGYGNAAYGNAAYGYGYNYPTPISGAYGYSAYTPNQSFKVPQNQDSLTAEERQLISSAKPASALDLNIEPVEEVASKCNHKENGVDISRRLNNGRRFCPRCNETWSTISKTNEEVTELTNDVIDQIQVIKWVGDLPINTIRDYSGIIPLLKKLPALYNYAMKNFEKYNNSTAYQTQNDASIYAQYEALRTPQYGAPYQQPYYPQPQQQVGGYYAQPGQAPIAPPTMNPMQAPVGINPMAPNQQFNQQVANMMPYGQPQVQQQAAVPQTAPATQQQAAPFNYAAPQAYQPQATQNTTTTVDGSKITTQSDGTVTVEKKLNI